VVDTAGRPLPGSRIVVRDPSVSSSTPVITADADGRFRAFVYRGFRGEISAYHPRDNLLRMPAVEHDVLAGQTDLVLTIPDRE
jgi:hypothetical protein